MLVRIASIMARCQAKSRAARGSGCNAGAAVGPDPMKACGGGGGVDHEKLDEVRCRDYHREFFF